MGLIGSAFLFGIVIGCSTLTRLGDVYGRKPIYILGFIMHIGFMIGILIQRTSSHFGPAMNIQGTLLTSRAVALSYAGASIGDLLSGLIS